MANTVRCPNGHFFDMNKFRFYPHCGLPASMPSQQPEMQPVPPAPPAPPVPPAPTYMNPPMPPQQPGFMPPPPPAPGFMPQPVMPQGEPDDHINQTSGW